MNLQNRSGPVVRGAATRALLRRAAARGGVVTAADAAREGLRSHQLGALVRRGVLHRVRRGVYFVAGAPLDYRSRVVRALALGPPEAVASHTTAAFLLRLDAEPPEVHITIDPAHRVQSDLVVAHRSPVPITQRAMVGSIATTSLGRTVVDLAAVYDVDRLATILDPLLASGRLSASKLLRLVPEFTEAPGRPGTGILRRALDPWLEGLRPESPGEARLLRRLTELGLVGFETQLEVHVGGRRFRLDVGWSEDRVGLEYAGAAFHGPRHFAADEERRRLLEAAGWRLREVDAVDLTPSRTEIWDWVRRSLAR